MKGRTVSDDKAETQWWIEYEHGARVAGPFTTQWDANLAREWIERVLKPETFWIRGYGLNRAGSEYVRLGI